MLKSEMQHQYWVTKKTVQRKLGGKEDECVVSSDQELDTKIDLFKSIADSCTHLYRVIDLYQERMCILAQEENALGKFLKENGKLSVTSSKVMISAGKSISYCGQQRMAIRSPLVRLHHEVETFRERAIADTHVTIAVMEKERTEYRAALSWMKSASAQLDPDSGKGLEKFRRAQSHVRISKQKFDRLTLDCLQKIDLLAAARCNMFSHALVAYQSSLIQFATKTTETFRAASKILDSEPHYTFSILKELTQEAKEQPKEALDEEEKLPDKDRMLFFQEDYKDEKIIAETETPAAPLGENSQLLIDGLGGDPEKTDDLLGLSMDFGDFMSSTAPSFMPSQLLDNLTTLNLVDAPTPEATDDAAGPTKTSAILELFNRAPAKPSTGPQQDAAMPSAAKRDTKPGKSAWFDLFSELDPFANPDTMSKQIDGGSNSHAA
ncbi:islet cell autoantigen 1 [Phlebotomus argentipes]|uniref:islet cell autoantigen 1 n=1 Tax=Phlebotomus argentipes TaxID=94469 RepID=UPI0028936E21|nr:islet cell autoantigen 1 [Phlebotomus argentipes]